MSDYDWDKLGEKAKELTSTYPKSYFPDLNRSHYLWSDESYEIAKSFVYENIVEKEVPSNEYIKKGI
jgi:hypothetical protein